MHRILLQIIVCALFAISALGIEPSLQQADKLFGLHKYAEAEPIYLSIVGQGGKEAFLALKQLACLYIATGDKIKADAAFEGLLSVFSSESSLPKQIILISDAYIKVNDIDKAAKTIQQINNQSATGLLWANVGAVKVEIAKEQDAQQKVSSILTDFAEHPDLAEAVFSVAQGYWIKSHQKVSEAITLEQTEPKLVEQHQYLLNALNLYEKIINDMNASQALLQDIYFSCGDCYRLLEERLKAAYRYDEFVRQWPGHEYAASAQFLVGQCYEQQYRMTGYKDLVIGEKAKAAYQKVVDNYPDSPLASIASRKYGIGN